MTTGSDPDLPQLTLTVGPAANGGSCVARYDGRVVFVRHALPGERVQVRVTAERGSHWHADVVEVLDPSPDRIDSLCPIAGADGAGCCDLAFAEPDAARRLKADVVTNQLSRLGGYEWAGVAESVGSIEATGWRTRVRLDTGHDGRAGFHRYHSPDLVTTLSCAQVPAGVIVPTRPFCFAGWTKGDGRLVRNCTSPSTMTASGTWCGPGRERAARRLPPR